MSILKKVQLPLGWNQNLMSGFFCMLAITVLGFTGCEKDPAQPQNLAAEALNPALWQDLEEPTLGFKARFPGKWKYHTEFMQTGGGVATVHIFEYWHIAFQYGITVVKFPPGVADMSEPERVLDYAIQSLIDEHGGTISYQEKVNMSGYPARRAMISLPESYLKSARLNTLIVLRNQFVYRVSTSGVGNHDYIEYFMDEFALTPVSVSIE